MSHHITELYSTLFETLQAAKSGTMKAEQIKLIGETAQVIINAAKVEVEHAKVVGGAGSAFINAAERAARQNRQNHHRGHRQRHQDHQRPAQRRDGDDSTGCGGDMSKEEPLAVSNDQLIRLLKDANKKLGDHARLLTEQLAESQKRVVMLREFVKLLSHCRISALSAAVRS